MTEVSTGSRVLPIANPRQTLGAVRHLLRPRRTLTAGALGVLAGGTAVGLLTPPLLGHIVDVVARGGSVDRLTIPALALVAVAIVQAVGTAIGIGMIARLGEGMLAELRERFVDRVLRLSVNQVERAGSGDLTSRVTNDVAMIANAVRGALPELVRSVLIIGLTLAGLAVLDLRFLAAALLAAPIQWHTVRWYVRRSAPLYAAHRLAVGAQQQQLLETVAGAPTVRALRLAPSHLDRVTARSQAAVDLALRAVALITRFYGRLNLAEFVGLSAVLVAGFLLVRAGEVTIGTATAAALYFHNLFGPVNSALRLVDDVQVAAASLARLVGVTNLDPPATPSPAPVGTAKAPAGTAKAPVGSAKAPVGSAKAPAGTGPAAVGTSPEVAGTGSAAAAPQAVVDASLKVVDVRYAYRPGHPVLSGVTLDIEAGQRVALVGSSGAGKTTLAQLVAGVHRPTGGAILLGGVDLAGLTADQRRRTIAVVTQETHVFAGPLADDLRLARPDATDPDLHAALAEVEALDWALALPDGLATVVGDGGHALDFAQAQQVALARLILVDPRVVVLDEATADAGSAGARVLERAAERALRGRTALVIAHRLTQAAAADRIVFLDNGRIVETGGHEELIGRPEGRYAALWHAWSRAR